MARVTRSTKVTIAEDESSLPAPQAKHEPPAEARAPLEEINNGGAEEIVSLEDAQMADEEKLLKAAFKTAIGVKKKNKKGKGKRKADQQQSSVDEVAPDDQPGPLSPTAEEAPIQLQVDPGQGPVADDTPDAPHEAAVRRTRSQMRSVPPPPVQQEPIYVHSALLQPMDVETDGDAVDAVVETPKSSASVIIEERDNEGTTPEPQSSQEDSFIEHIVDRSPAKPVSRKYSAEDLVALRSPTKPARSEDSVESLDNFEEVVTRSPAKPVSRKYSAEDLVALRSPTKPARFEDSVESLDNFEEIVTRSPTKPVSRIEDSVEALDKMEEVIEALTEAARAQELASPTKSKKAPPPILKMAPPPVVKKSIRQPTVSPPARPVVTKARTIGAKEGKALASEMMAPKKVATARATSTSTVRPRPAEIKNTTLIPNLRRSASAEPKQAAPIAKRPMAKRPLSLLPPKEPVRTTKPPTRANFELPGEAVARRLKEQREARVAQRQSSITSDAPHAAAKAAAPKVKSTKPPTKAAFELPGEALSRRKREAHEARLKAQEDEERKRREFKAKPLRKSVAPSVQLRDTAASRARKSVGGAGEDAAAGLAMPKRRAVAPRPSMAAANVAAPRSSVSVPPAALRMASSSSTATAGGLSMSGLAGQRAVSAQAQRSRGREMYMRDARALEGAERERREKEAAAKRAREEAAERGRVASREWAEMKRRRGGDEGLGVGFGPGGQMGLGA